MVSTTIDVSVCRNMHGKRVFFSAKITIIELIEVLDFFLSVSHLLLTRACKAFLPCLLDYTDIIRKKLTAAADFGVVRVAYLAFTRLTQSHQPLVSSTPADGLVSGDCSLG